MNISNVKNCYGCGVCVLACGHKLINIELNADGFYEPKITSLTKCTDCGLCASVCAFLSIVPDDNNSPQYSCAAWSNDSNIRRLSTSGGVCYEISKYLLGEGFDVIGVHYNTDECRAEHSIASSIEELRSFQGSKYLQSYTINAIRKIDRKKKYLFIGTPCQVASMRRYIRKFGLENRFVLLDFFCHGVPSLLLWKKYLFEKAQKLGKIKLASWRNKERGWHKGYCVTLKDSASEYKSFITDRDDFFTLFLGDACLGHACYHSCKFKYDKSCADIRIGDFWGAAYRENEQGVCAVSAFTDKGLSILEKLDITQKEYPFEIVAQGQMKLPAKRPWYYKMSMLIIKSKFPSLRYIAIIIRIHKRIYRLFTKKQK